MTRTQQKTFERFTDIGHISDDPFISVDLLRMLCGEKIGEGEYRAVYNLELKKDWVLKISIKPFSNQMEYNIWQTVKGEKISKWFAPCYFISPCGHFLIQKKVRRVTEKDKLPKVLPAFFADTKKTNFGFIGSQLVCHDYHLCNAIDVSFAAQKEAKWKE